MLSYLAWSTRCVTFSSICEIHVAVRLPCRHVSREKRWYLSSKTSLPISLHFPLLLLSNKDEGLYFGFTHCCCLHRHWLVQANSFKEEKTARWNWCCVGSVNVQSINLFIYLVLFPQQGSASSYGSSVSGTSYFDNSGSNNLGYSSGYFSGYSNNRGYSSGYGQR